ncbi:MAG: hypothetical protein V7736_00505 [Colwellia polaris]|jgi:hypothetical protein
MSRSSVIFIIVLITSQAVNAQDQWKSVKQVDDMTGIKSTISWQESDDGKGVIRFGCQNKELFLNFLGDRFLTDYGGPRTLFKIDSNETIKPSTSISTTYTSVIISNWKNKLDLIVSQIKAGNKLKIRTYNYQKVSQDYLFELKGSAKHISKVLNDCL